MTSLLRLLDFPKKMSQDSLSSALFNPTNSPTYLKWLRTHCVAIATEMKETRREVEEEGLTLLATQPLNRTNRAKYVDGQQ
jgi:hypothetical protein